MDVADKDRIPVTVLTGYLGAGKTTLLNRILGGDHGRRYAVIVNEFGEEGIDTELIVSSDEEIHEMNNGCVCCTVRGDLISAIERLARRKGRFDAIIVETTGLADPAPVAQTFFMDDDMRRLTRLDAVVALADAKHLPARLQDSREAADQVAFADIVLLNKTDLVEPDQLGEVEAEIRRLNPTGRIFRTRKADVPLEQVLDIGAFDLKRALAHDPAFLDDELDSHHHHHHHDHDHECGEDCDHDHGHIEQSGLTSVSLTGGELKSESFFYWIRAVTEANGPDILRLKGILAFAGDPDRYVIQGIHMLIEGDHQRPWKADEQRRSRLVFIGRNLDREKLERSFAACAA